MSQNDFHLLREQELIRGYQDGNDAAFDALVEATKRQAFALAFRWTRDQAQASDIVQETYIKLLAQLPRWNYSCRVQTWLYRVITNACIDHRRNSRFVLLPLTDQNDDCPAPELTAPGRSPQEHAETADRVRLLERCLARLPARMQAAIRLRYLSDLSLQEVSEMQECSVGTIKATLFQALRKLRVELTRAETEGVT